MKVICNVNVYSRFQLLQHTPKSISSELNIEANLSHLEASPLPAAGKCVDCGGVTLICRGGNNLTPTPGPPCLS